MGLIRTFWLTCLAVSRIFLANDLFYQRYLLG